MWSGGTLEYGRPTVSLYGIRDAAAHWKDACAKVLQEHQFVGGVACLSSFYSRERGIRVVVRGDDLLPGGPEHQLEWMRSVMKKHSSPQTLTSVGKYSNTVHSPFSTKRWAYGRPIRAAITKYGSTWILWSGAAVNHILKDTSDDSS